VIIGAHPTKEVKGKDGKLRVPGLYDISGSAHWYNAPDHGLVVHRPMGSGRYCEVHIMKARFARSGQNGSAWLRFEVEGLDAGRYVSSLSGPNGAA
jgi:twinkle protein